MLLKPTRLPTDLFGISYDKKANLLVAEASTLPNPSRVWDDACDEGYTVVSHRTGHAVVYVAHGVTTRDGDILYCDYMPLEPFGRYIDPNLPAMRVFND